MRLAALVSFSHLSATHLGLLCGSWWDLLPDLLYCTDADVTVALAPEIELLVKVVGEGHRPFLQPLGTTFQCPHPLSTSDCESEQKTELESKRTESEFTKRSNRLAFGVNWLRPYTHSSLSFLHSLLPASPPFLLATRD